MDYNRPGYIENAADKIKSILHILTQKSNDTYTRQKRNAPVCSVFFSS